jgi:hypothetical protein
MCEERKEEVEVGLRKGGEMERKHGRNLTVNDEENDSSCRAFLQQKASSFKLPKSMIFQTHQLTSLYFSSSLLLDASKNPMQLQLYFPGDAPEEDVLAFNSRTPF